MIGGIDVRVPTLGAADALCVAVRAIRQSWPRAVFENGVTGERYDRFSQIPFGPIEELFVYRDSVAADAWDAQGATPALANTMVHIIADGDLMTLVVDDRDAAMNELIDAVQSAMTDNIHFIPARLKDAA